MSNVSERELVAVDGGAVPVVVAWAVLGMYAFTIGAAVGHELTKD